MNRSDLLDKIKKHYNFKTDTAFANFLEIKPNVISNWKARNVFDVDKIFTKCEGISAEWLLTGEGKMFRQENIGQNEQAQTQVDLENPTKFIMKGNSMSPLIENGDEISFKPVSTDLKNVLWGSLYLLTIEIDGEHLKTLRYIYPAENPEKILLVAKNSAEYAPKELDFSQVKEMGLATVLVRRLV